MTFRATSLLLLLVLVLAGCAMADLAPPERSYNVLMMLPCTSKSHLFMFMPLAEGLAKRGHKITIVDNTPTGIKNENITFIQHGLSHFKTDDINFVEIGSSYFQLVKYVTYNMYSFTKEFYNVPAIAKLYEERDKMDVVIIDHFVNEVAYPFAHGKPYISMVITGQDHLHSASIGNYLNPAYVSHSIDNLKHPMSLATRTFNFAVFMALPIIRYFVFILPIQIQIDKIFPELPSLLEIEQNQSLALMNSHFSMFSPIRMLPTQIEMGGMHCKPGKPLPQNLHDFISGTEPVIYVSFGSAFSAKCMPEYWKKTFIEGLSRIQHKILWKFDEDIPNLPKHILRMNWFPQQDILAHPNVKLYIAHGGMMGIQESIYHSVPMLVLPIWTDQPKNAHRVENMGMGRFLEWPDITVDRFTELILEVLNNNKYTMRVKEMSRLLRDQPQSALERSVYWTEYVIRHRGAPHLRSSELELNWFQFLSLDVLLTGLFIIYITYRLFKKLTKYIYFKVCEGKNRLIVNIKHLIDYLIKQSSL